MKTCEISNCDNQATHLSEIYDKEGNCYSLRILTATCGIHAQCSLDDCFRTVEICMLDEAEEER